MASAAGRVARGAAAAGIGAAAVASATASESRAAPQDEQWDLVIPQEALAEASELMKKEMKAQNMLFSTTSADGTEWLDTIDPVEAILNFAEEVGAEPAVQRTIMEKSRDQALVLRLMQGQPSLASQPSRSHPSLASSFQSVAAPDEECVEVSESMPSVTSSVMAEAASDFDHELVRAHLLPRVVRIQAAARDLLTRRGFYEARAGRRAAKQPAVRCSIEPADGKGIYAHRVNLALVINGLDDQEGVPRRTDVPFPTSAVLGVSLVVGLLALLIMRNPVQAKSAAAGAAATVAALCRRAAERQAANARVPRS